MAKTHFLGTLGLALFVASAGIGRAEGLVADSVKPLLEGTALSGSLLAQNSITEAGTTALSARASKRLRMSPTAGMAKLRRRAAELPPESKGVTR